MRRWSDEEVASQISMTLWEETLETTTSVMVTLGHLLGKSSLVEGKKEEKI